MFKQRCNRSQEILAKTLTSVKYEKLEDTLDPGINTLEYAEVQCKVETDLSDDQPIEDDKVPDTSGAEDWEVLENPDLSCEKNERIFKLPKKKKKSNSGTDRHRCSLCLGSFQTSKILATHLKSQHKGAQDKQCQYCEKLEFADLYSDHLAKCQKNSEKNNPVVCPDCGVLIAPHRLNAHIKTKHVKTQPFKCDLCGIMLKTKSSVLIHMRIVHLNYRFKCTECDETFRLPFNRNCHLRKAHTDKYGLFQCSYCEYSTHSKSHLKRHTKAHQGLASRTYKCNQCSLSFYMSYHLKEHMATHSDERPHVCETCSAAFKTRRNLLVHKKSHLEHQYECPVCQRRFLTNQIMRNHCTKQHPDYALPPPGTIMNKGALQRIAEGKVPITKRILKPVMLITPELVTQLPHKQEN